MPADKTYTQAELDEALKQQKADFSSSETDLKDQINAERTNRLKGEHNAFVQQQINDGKLTPAMAAGCVDFMLQLSSDTEFEFSQGDGDDKKTTKTDAVAWFKDFVSGLGKSVSLGESDDDDIDSAASDFAAPGGLTVDADRLALDKKARDYMATHECDYVEAVVAVGG